MKIALTVDDVEVLGRVADFVFVGTIARSSDTDMDVVCSFFGDEVATGVALFEIWAAIGDRLAKSKDLVPWKQSVAHTAVKVTEEMWAMEDERKGNGGNGGNGSDE